MADEFIHRNYLIKQLYLVTDISLTSPVMQTIKTFPAADVQPVDRWINVENRLPEADYDCLVWYSCDTAFGKSKSWGITHCSRCDWYTKHLNGDNIVVTHWQPLPVPPRD